MRASAILFDKDGTLFDFQQTWGGWLGDVIDELSAGDAQTRANLATIWGYDLKSRVVLGNSVVVAGTVHDVAELALSVLPEMAAADLYRFLDQTATQIAPVPAAALRPLLDRLASLGMVMGVATNDSENSARTQLRHAGIEQDFDFIAGCDSGFGGKPDTGMCLAFVEHCGIEAADIVMVGDSTHDLIAGRAAGMQTIAVLTGVATAGDLAPFADVVWPDIGHLPGWLAK